MLLLGAFAIFVSSGVPLRRALCLLSGCYIFSYVGVVIGAVLGAIFYLTAWIFAVIAGIFLYIALAEMVSCSHITILCIGPLCPCPLPSPPPPLLPGQPPGISILQQIFKMSHIGNKKAVQMPRGEVNKKKERKLFI